MSDVAVLFAKPGSVKPADKRALSKAGIIVVEVADPADVKFVRAATELPAGDLLAAAASAVNSSAHVQRIFGETVAKILASRLREGK